LPETSPRLCFGAWICRGYPSYVARFLTASCFRLSFRRGRTENYCPILHRALLSVGPPERPDRKSLPETSTRPCFGAWICRGYPSYVARFLTASCFRLSFRRGRTENHCPILHRGPASVHRFVAAARHMLPGFSPRLAFGCRSGAAGQKIIARYFNAALLRCMSMSRLSVIRCPGFHRALLSVVPPARPDRKSLPDTSTQPYFGAWICRGYPSYVARFLTAPCFRLSLRRGRTENHCPKLQRALAFGCPSGAAGHKIIARYFIAALLRCIDLSRLPVICCPVSHRALLSVVPPARPDRKSLPDTSSRPSFGCPSGAAGQKIIARYFNAALLRCMSMSRLSVIRCPDFHRALLSVVAPAQPG